MQCALVMNRKCATTRLVSRGMVRVLGLLAHVLVAKFAGRRSHVPSARRSASNRLAKHIRAV